MGGDWITSEVAREQVAGYVLHERIGRGSDSEVYRAEEVGRPGRVLAIKRIGSALNPTDVASLRREAEALRVLAHPGVVRLVDVVHDAEGIALVLPYASGGSLTARLEQGPLPPVEVADLGARLAAALAAIHTAGLVHGDVKPGNVLFDREDQPLLADLGVSRLRGAGPPHGATAGFVAPEVLAGAPVDTPADLYALGVTLGYALGLDPAEQQQWASAEAGDSRSGDLGRHPQNEPGARHLDDPVEEAVDDPDLEALLAATRTGPDTATTWPAVDGQRRLRAAIAAALAADPANRPRTAAELAGLLDEARRCLEAEGPAPDHADADGARHPGYSAAPPGSGPPSDGGVSHHRTSDAAQVLPREQAPTRPFGPKPPTVDETGGQDELAALRRWLAVPAMLAVALTPIAFAVWLVLGAGQM